MKENNIICSCCGAVLNEDTTKYFDGQYLCEDCFDNETVLCDNCGERIWRDDVEGDSNLTLCSHCYEYNYTTCEDCGRLIHNEYAYYEDGEDYPYCRECFEKLNDNAIKNYSYKPEPIFYGSGNLFYGVELEIDKGGDDSYNAQKLLDIANIQDERIYCKHDGSISDGFEIVSHPMSLDYHINSMNWLDVFEKAVELNSKHPASIDLDARVIESEALEQAFKNGTLKESTQKVLNLKTQEELLDFIHNNPEDFTVKMAKMSDVLPTLKQATQADNIDYRQFIDLDEFKGVAQKLNKLGCKFENFKQTDIADKSIEIFLKAVKKLKRMAILGNIGICIGVLGVIAPALMVALRKLDKNNQGFQVKEDLKKQMAFNGKI